MSANSQQVWLTEDAHDRLKHELVALRALREIGAGGEADAMEHDQREFRIRQLHELLTSAVVQEPPDDGVAEPGMVLTIHWDGEADTETFLMADREGSTVHGGLEVCSPRSPLGRALVGAVPGEQREYRTPDGARMRVTLVAAVPHQRAG